MSKWIKFLVLTIAISLININVYAFGSKDAATQFQLNSIDKAAAPLSYISEFISLYYYETGDCPSPDQFQLTLPNGSDFHIATNNNCVAIATFKHKDLPQPLRGKTIAVGPTWVVKTSTWNFSNQQIATNIRSNPLAESLPHAGSSSALLNQSSDFIGGVYAKKPETYLASKG
jgi:hypothetical protein